MCTLGILILCEHISHKSQNHNEITVSSEERAGNFQIKRKSLKPFREIVTLYPASSLKFNTLVEAFEKNDEKVWALIFHFQYNFNLFIFEQKDTQFVCMQ